MMQKTDMLKLTILIISSILTILNFKLCDFHIVNHDIMNQDIIKFKIKSNMKGDSNIN